MTTFSKVVQSQLAQEEEMAASAAGRILRLIDNLAVSTKKQFAAKLNLTLTKSGAVALSETNLAAIVAAADAAGVHLAARIGDLQAGIILDTLIAKFASDGAVHMAAVAWLQGDKLKKIKLTTDALLVAATKERILDLIKASASVQTDIKKVLISGMLTGASRRAMRDEIAGLSAAISPARAKLIAESELMASYGQAGVMTAAQNGYIYFGYMGPLDGRTEPVCRAQVGKVRKLSDWILQKDIDGNEVGGKIVLYGLHYGCRHRLVGVRPDWPGVEVEKSGD